MKKGSHTGFTPAQLTLDHPDDPKIPPPLDSPQMTGKGKRRASNSTNINPKSQSTSGVNTPNPFGQYEEYASKRDAGELSMLLYLMNPFSNILKHISSCSGKAQVARDSLSFEMMKFERQVANDNKGVQLEEKKFNHSIQLEEKKWDYSMKLDEKKWDHGIKLEEKKLDWQKEEKDWDRNFEMAKLDHLASQEHVAKKYDLVTQCVAKGKSVEEIERLAKMFN
jgi:hypothetical protein